MYNKNILTKVVFAAIFCFSYLKAKDTESKIWSDRFAFSTPKLCKNKREKHLHSNVEQISMFHIPAQAKYAHFQKRLQYSLI